jgi:hypothetical protein
MSAAPKAVSAAVGEKGKAAGSVARSAGRLIPGLLLFVLVVVLRALRVTH